jgi:hypothetical protein
MTVSIKKLSAITATLMLSLVGVGAISAPAKAADCKYPVENQAANDNPKANIRLISPVLTDDNSIRRYDFEGSFTIDCDWFGVGMRFNQVYVPFGLTTNLTFQATKPNGDPLAFTKVTLRANKGYSASNAAVKVNGIKARPAPSTAADGANVIGTTDVNGNVTFVVQSPADCETYGGVLPAAPTSPSADTPNDVNADPATDCFSQFLPSITGEKTDSADFIELHYFNPAGLDYTAEEANLSVAAPFLDDTNSIPGDGLLQTYAPVGSKQIIVFEAKRLDGSFVRNHPVKIKINKANSGANAKLTAGLIGVTGSAIPLPADATKTAEDQLVLTGTTDAFGNVAFVITNTDTAGEAKPATKTTPVPTEGAVFASIVGELTGTTTNAITYEPHFYKAVVVPVPVTSITVAASGRKITVTINNAIGKTSTVSITGKAKVTLKPTVAKKVLTYTVTKGTKKVVITANGKTLTKTFIIK